MTNLEKFLLSVSLGSTISGIGLTLSTIFRVRKSIQELEEVQERLEGILETEE